MFDKLSEEDKEGALGSIAGQAMQRYKKLYAIEARIKEMAAKENLDIRQSEAKPLWEAFIE